MVGVAQLVEPRVVIPVVVGSSPIVHPKFAYSELKSASDRCELILSVATKNQVKIESIHWGL